MITNYNNTGRYYIVFRDNLQVAEELAQIVVHEQPKAMQIDELTDWLDTRCDIVDASNGEYESAMWFAGELLANLGRVDDLRCKLDKDGRAVYHVRFTDERMSTYYKRDKTAYVDLTLVYHDMTWEGDTSSLEQCMLDDARIAIQNGRSSGSVYMFDLVSFEVQH